MADSAEDNVVENSDVEVDVLGPIELLVLVDALVGATVLDTVAASVVGDGVVMIVRRTDDDVLDCSDVEIVADRVDDDVVE